MLGTIRIISNSFLYVYIVPAIKASSSVCSISNKSKMAPRNSRGKAKGEKKKKDEKGKKINKYYLAELLLFLFPIQFLIMSTYF